MNKKLIFSIIILSFSFAASAQELEDRYLSQANQEYLKKNYIDAYQYINFVFNLYDGEELPLPARILGEKVYFFYINSLIEEASFENLDEVLSKLDTFPSIASFRVKQAAVEIQQLKSDMEEAARIEAEKLRQAEEEQRRIEQINQALEEERAAYV